MMGHALSLRARRSAFLSDRDPSGRPAVAGELAGGGGLAVEEPQEVQDEEYERVYERVAAIDVAKASGVVCMRLRDPARPGRYSNAGSWARAGG